MERHSSERCRAVNLVCSITLSLIIMCVTVQDLLGLNHGIFDGTEFEKGSNAWL